jgi:hypothetical protein
MSRSDHLALPEDPEEGQQPKKKRFGNEKVERIMLVVAIVLMGAAIKLYMGDRRVETGESRIDILTILQYGLASEVQPKNYDPNRELRLAAASVNDQGRLEPFVMVLRGPWAFGTAEIETVALELGQPKYRGSGYLIYDLADGKIRLTLLFNTQRLDTVAVAPNPCPKGEPECAHPYRWGVTQAQITDESLQWDPPKATDEKCGILGTASLAIYYDACPDLLPPKNPPVRGIYVQRLTAEMRNPPHIRGVPEPGLSESAAARTELGDPDYQRLLAQFGRASDLKDRALGPEHSSGQFLKFERGRMEAQTGHLAEGGKTMLEAIQTLEKTLGKQHPDLTSMRAWLPTAGALKAARTSLAAQ